MRYFVTGGTGFIGGRLVAVLQERSHEVVSLVRNPMKAARLANLGVEIAAGDVTDRASLVAPMRGVDGVFHVAAWFEVGTDATSAEAVNVDGTRNVLETMRELGIPKGVYTSTVAINSNTHGRVVDESYRFEGRHISRYDETKARAHHEVALPLIAKGLPLVVLMPGLVYGPGDTGQMGALMRRALEGRRVLLPGGSAGVCWAHIDDIADAHVRAMERGEIGRSYIVTGPCHTFREGFETAARVVGAPLRAVFVPPIVLHGLARLMAVVERVVRVPGEFSSEGMRVGGGTTYYGDNALARRALGFEPRPLERGLAETFGASRP
ncbi:NAD-dependent epimerase/dehydratase family protein [soil metagenome]